MNGRWHGLLPLLLFSIAGSGMPPAPRAETIGACTNPEVSDAIKESLQPQGVRVTGDGGVLCEVWFRKVLSQTAGNSNTEYGSLTIGSFVGVIAYPSKAGDYRGQILKPGTYTMRYQPMPADGNHMGVSPTQEYVLLTPASLDKDPGAVIDYDSLLNLSRKASTGSHVVPLYLVSPTGDGSPAFRGIGDGRWALEAKAKASGGGAEIDFPLALVLIGKGEA